MKAKRYISDRVRKLLEANAKLYKSYDVLESNGNQAKVRLVSIAEEKRSNCVEIEVLEKLRDATKGEE